MGAIQSYEHAGAHPKALGGPASIGVGDYGADYIADTNARTGKWRAIQILTDTVFTTLTADNITGSMATLSLTAGQILVGHFTAITLQSGSVMAYRSADF